MWRILPSWSCLHGREQLLSRKRDITARLQNPLQITTHHQQATSNWRISGKGDLSVRLISCGTHIDFPSTYHTISCANYFFPSTGEPKFFVPTTFEEKPSADTACLPHAWRLPSPPDLWCEAFRFQAVDTRRAVWQNQNPREMEGKSCRGA